MILNKITLIQNINQMEIIKMESVKLDNTKSTQTNHTENEFNEYKELKILNITQFISINANTFYGFTNLAKLDISENQISELAENSFKDLRNLKNAH